MEPEGGQISVAEFGVAFKGFLDQAAAQARVDEPFFVRRLNEHFAGEAHTLPVVAYEFPARDHPNLQLALDAYLSRDGRKADSLGVASAYKRFNGVGFAELLAPRGGGLMSDGGASRGPVEYVDVALGEGETLTCLKSGLLLIDDGDTRLAVLVGTPDQGQSRGQVRVEVMGSQREQAERFLAEVRTGALERNVYRGRVVSLEQERYGPLHVRLHALPVVNRDEIILPSGVLERVERHTLEFSEHVAELRAAGQHTKRGLLLFGPPGTGKTLTAKYVAGKMPDRTVVLVTGTGDALLEPACAIARLLQPSTVIIEDVDLIAEERTREDRNSTRLLFELLNQMDGMEEDADVVFLLTTNRPELLEPALAARPGRVDLAIEIPLPDDGCRRRLFELYTRGVVFEVDDLDHYVERTRNVSAAFIRELVRKAALNATADGSPPTIRDHHLNDALQELLFEGGELTRSLLGAHASQT